MSDAYYRQSRGIPISRAPEVHLTNNHLQYIFTWCVLHFSAPRSIIIDETNCLSRYGLAVATSYMFWLVVRKPPVSLNRRVKRSNEWWFGAKCPFVEILSPPVQLSVEHVWLWMSYRSNTDCLSCAMALCTICVVFNIEGTASIRWT